MYRFPVTESGRKEDKPRLAVLGDKGIGNNIQYFLGNHFYGKLPEVECFPTVEKLLEKAEKHRFDAVVASYSPFINDGFEGHVYEIIKACNQKKLFVLFPWENKEIQKLEGQGVCELINPLEGKYEGICNYIEQHTRGRA